MRIIKRNQIVWVRHNDRTKMGTIKEIKGQQVLVHFGGGVSKWFARNEIMTEQPKRESYSPFNLYGCFKL